MAIQYVGGQVAGRAGIASTASITFSLTGGLASTPAVGDLVIITAVVGTQARNPAQAISGYTAIGQLNPTAQTYDTSLNVSWKFLTTAETTFTLPSTGNVADAQRYTVQVFRGVDPGANISALAAAASGTGTSRCNPASVTPTVAGSWVVICGGGAAATGANYTAPANFTTNFLTGFTADTNDALVGSGYWTGWTSGAVDPAGYTGGATATTSSWAAYTLVLPPAGEPPVITNQPDNASAVVGGTADFTVEFDAADTVQWETQTGSATQRTQIGAVWQESSITTTGFTAQSRNITAGSLVIGFFKAETASVEINQTVTDTAGGVWNVVRSRFGSVNSHILYSFDHPGGVGVVISSSFTGGTVVTAETKIRFAEFVGAVGESDPILQAVTSGDNNLQLSHTHNVPTGGLTLAVQGSYYGVAFTLTSPATLLVNAYNTMNVSIQLSTGASVLHAGGGGAGQQANISVTVAPVTTLSWGNVSGGSTSTGSTSSTYTTPTLSGADAGKQYRVVLTNAFGSTTSTAATLSIPVPVATGPLTVSDETPIGYTIGGFSATDPVGSIVGWRYSLNEGAGWTTFGGTSFAVTGRTKGDVDTVWVQAQNDTGAWSNTLTRDVTVGYYEVSATGLEFNNLGASITLKMDVAPTFTEFTYAWREKLISPQATYYAGGWIIALENGASWTGTTDYFMPVPHGADDGTFNATTGQRNTLAASPMWQEIAMNGSLDRIASHSTLVGAGETQESYLCEYGVWRTRVCQARVVGANVEFANYVDWDNDRTKVIRQFLPVSGLYGTTISMYLGSVPWATEHARGKFWHLFAHQAYLTPEQIDAEFQNFTNTPSAPSPHYRNVFPALSAGVVADNKGTGTAHPFNLTTGTSPAAFTETVLVEVPADTSTVSSADPATYTASPAPASGLATSFAQPASLSYAAIASSSRLSSTSTPSSFATTVAPASGRVTSNATPSVYAVVATAASDTLTSFAAASSYTITAFDAFGTVSGGVVNIVSSADPASFGITIPATSTGTLTSSAPAASLAITPAASSAKFTSASASSAYTLTVFTATSGTLYTSSAVPAAYSATAFNAASVLRSLSEHAGYAITAFNATSSILIAGGYPDPADVRIGVSYGPTGTEYTGTYAGGVGRGVKLDIATGRRVLVLNNKIVRTL